MNEFNIGDRVKLNSGGPDMTVCSVALDDQTISIRTNWFDRNKLMDGIFPAEALDYTVKPWPKVDLEGLRKMVLQLLEDARKHPFIPPPTSEIIDLEIIVHKM